MTKDAVSLAIPPTRRLHVVSPSSDLMPTVGQLRYRAYRSVEAISENPQESFLDEFDRQDHCTSFLLTAGSMPLASIRALVHGPRSAWRRTVAHAVYADAIHAAIGADSSFVESNRFVVEPSSNSLDLSILLVLFKAIAIAAVSEEVQWIVTAVRKKHEGVYTKWLGFQRISEPRFYPGLDFEMVLLLRAVDDDLRHLLAQRPLTQVTDTDLVRFRTCKTIAL